MIADASALVDLLLPTPRGQVLVEVVGDVSTPLGAPEIVDAEVASALRRLARRGDLDATRAEQALSRLDQLAIVRYPTTLLLRRAWQLRENFTIYDALYVALAEATELPLLTTDQPLARAVAEHTAVELAD